VEAYEIIEEPEVISVISEAAKEGVSATGVYKVPEYYGHSKMTYYQFEVDMQKQRLQVPKKDEAYVQVGM